MRPVLSTSLHYYINLHNGTGIATFTLPQFTYIVINRISTRFQLHIVITSDLHVWNAIDARMLLPVYSRKVKIGLRKC